MYSLKCSIREKPLIRWITWNKKVFQVKGPPGQSGGFFSILRNFRFL